MQHVSQEPVRTASSNTSVVPPWLQDSSPPQAQSSQYSPPSQKFNGAYSSVPSAPTSEGTTVQSSVIDPAVPKMILYTRIINLVLSIAMIMVSLLSMLTTQSATTGVLACYVVIFACLLCCFETHLKQVSKIIAMNFGFMYSAKSRAAFMIFIGMVIFPKTVQIITFVMYLGTIMFSFSLFGKLIGLMMLANAGFNIFILFKYPQFEDAQRNHAQSEIKDYLASNPAFAQQIMKASVSAGVDLFKSNPGDDESSQL